jgi:hypothetical protein
MTKQMSIRSYILGIVFLLTVTFAGAAFVLTHFGERWLGCRGVVTVLVTAYPMLLFAALNGFYRGLVVNYGFKGEERIFPSLW